MPSNPMVLVVVTSGDEDPRRDFALFNFCNELCSELAAKAPITLAAREPVDSATAIEFARAEEGNLLFVVVGYHQHLQHSIEMLTPVSSRIPPIPVAFDRGTATLQLSSIGRAQIVEIVLIAVRSFHAMHDPADAVSPSGEVVDFPRSAGARRELQPSAAADDGESQVHINQTLLTALDWADAATNVLVKIWSDTAGKENAVYGLSWDKLLASVERLLRIRDAPTDKAREKYRAVEAMLAHPSVEPTPLVRLSRQLELNDIALQLVMLVLAPELDIRFQRLFGALHDDMGRRFASVGLASAIIASATEGAAPRHIRAQLSALDTLRELRLVEGFGESMPPSDELLRIDSPVVDWLLTGEESWLTSQSFDAIGRPSPSHALQLLPAARRTEVERALKHGLIRQGDVNGFDAILLTGSEQGWIEIEAAALAGSEMRVGPPSEPMPSETLDRALREAIRASRLLGRRLVIEMFDTGGQSETFWRTLTPLLPLCRPTPYVIASDAAWLISLASSERIAVAPLPPVAQEHRAQAISAVISNDARAPSTLALELADRFHLPLAMLPDVAPLAIAAATTARLAQPDKEEWQAAFRGLASSRVPQFARRVPPRPRPANESLLDRVVLPTEQRGQLETLVSHVKVGGKVLRDWKFGDALDARGVSALFTGESGTGKTTAAHALASELGADLYAVDLSRIVDKYIGQTEKNLEIIFSEAEQAGAVLLFDEADALFGKRSAVNDAHDRYANIEVAYLLQRIETFDGLAILTTNHPGNIDPAFTRRLRFMIEFPFPTAQDRLRIWERVLPADSPHRGPDVDFVLASRRLELNGGSIRQIVLHAVMAAATTKDGVVKSELLRDAARTEFIRLGRRDKLESISGLFASVREEAA